MRVPLRPPVHGGREYVAAAHIARCHNSRTRECSCRALVNALPKTCGEKAAAGWCLTSSKSVPELESDYIQAGQAIFGMADFADAVPLLIHRASYIRH